MNAKLLTEYHLEFLSLKGGCTGSSESMLVKMPHCWKSHITAQLFFVFLFSMPYYKAGALYSSHHIADVQNSSLECTYPGLQSKCSLP